jgi:hypothetical protein
MNETRDEKVIENKPHLDLTISRVEVLDLKPCTVDTPVRDRLPDNLVESFVQLVTVADHLYRSESNTYQSTQLIRVSNMKTKRTWS